MHVRTNGSGYLYVDKYIAATGSHGVGISLTSALTIQIAWQIGLRGDV